MLNDRSNEAPEVTTVRTMGLLLSSPMSMYTEQGVGLAEEIYFLIFTVRSRQSSTDRGYRRTPADNELIVLTLVVCRLRLAQHHVLHVQSGAKHQIIIQSRDKERGNIF